MHHLQDPAANIRRLKRLIGAHEAALQTATRLSLGGSRFACELKWNVAFRRFQLAAVRYDLLTRKFDRNQPRVPAGRPEGGRWTRRDSQANSEGDSSFASRGNFTVDDSGTQAWESVDNEYYDDGSLAEQTVILRDGRAIRSEFADASQPTPWDERHSVLSTDGNVFTFETSGNIQTIKDGTGQTIAASAWTNNGPVAEPFLQPAFAPPLPHPAAAGAMLAATGLYTWMSSENTADEKAVLAFNANAFVPGANVDANAMWVGKLSREEVDAACPRLAEVQSITDQSAAAIDRGAYESAATYGTAVHTRIRDEINGPPTTPRSPPQNPNFRAELSLLKSKDASYYGQKDSIRVDVYENPGNSTVCVYDVKTGDRGLTFPRSREIASNVQFYYPGTRRIIVTEIRPRR